MTIAADLQRLAVPVDQLTTLQGNPRIGDVEAVARSYERLGQRKPIVARHREDGMAEVIAGNHQLLAARRLGWSEIAVAWADDLTDDQARAFALADNRTADLGTYDSYLLAELLSYVADDADLLAATGYDEKFIEALVGVPELPEDVDDVPEVPETPVTAPGDVWILGEHRLICGDSTDPDVLDRLMAGGQADLVVTSPPYNQRIDTFKPSGMHAEGDWSAKVGRLAYADSLPEEEYQAGQILFLEAVERVMADGASLFYNHKNRYRDKQVVSPLQWLPGPFRFRQEIVWRRPGSVTQNARMFLPCDERIYWLYKGEDFTFDDTTEIKTWSTVWDIAPRTNKEHAVAFPVEIPTRAIRACTTRRQIVLDPYGGSGTTLIAAEETGRVARLVELDPRYCDVICRRFQDRTGIAPVLESRGELREFCG